MTDHGLLSIICDLAARGIPACMATIVQTRGSTPLGTGARMVFCADGTSFGSIGGGCAEGKVRHAALELLVGNGRHRLLPVDLLGEPTDEEGDSCGGRMSVFLEVLGGE